MANTTKSPAEELVEKHLNQAFDKIVSKYDRTTPHPLGENETAAGRAVNRPDGSSASPEELEQAEAARQKSFSYSPNGREAAEDDSLTKRAAKRATAKILKSKSARTLIIGEIVSAVIFLFSFISPFKIPSIMGDFQHHIGSSIVMRKLIEKRFERIVAEYFINKKLGNLPAKPGSSMDKLRKSFDGMDLELLVKQRHGMDMREVKGALQLFYEGRPVGKPFTDYRGYRQAVKLNPKLARSSRAIVTQTLPIMRMGWSSKFKRMIQNLYWPHRLHTPPTDDEDTPEENAKRLEEQALDALKEPLETLKKGTSCAVAPTKTGCELLEGDKNIQPIDTTREGFIDEIDVGTRPQDGTADAINDSVEQGLEETKKKGPLHGSYISRLIEEMITPLIGATASKVVTRMIPLVGWINGAAEVDHIVNVEGETHIMTRTMILIREQQYGAAAALWLSYADEIKAGGMSSIYISILNKRLNGYGDAGANKILNGGDPNTGVPVSPKVGNNQGIHTFEKFIGDLYGCAPRSSSDNSFFDFSNFEYCNSHFILNLWYNSIGYIFRGTDIISSVIITTIWQISPAKKILDAQMTKYLGPDWENKVAFVALTSLFKLFGILVEPLAVGAQLANNIYVGLDVLNNTYMQRNLGAAAVSAADSVTGYQNAENHYQESMASLPLRDRLFALDVPGSLSNQLILATPSSPDPSAAIATIMRPIRSLPGTFMSLISGRSMALATADQRAEFDWVEQMDIPDNLLDDSPTAQQVMDQPDPSCPANAPGQPNLCQTDKEIVGMALCFNTDCPELSDQ